MSELATFLEYCFTSWPFPVAILAIIIAIFVLWLVKIRPQDKEREATRDANNSKREEEFLKAMARNDENAKNTIIMYERALDNSTRAIENNSAALNMLSLEMKHLRDTSAAHDDSLEKVQTQTQKTNETLVKVVTLLESKDK